MVTEVSLTLMRLTQWLVCCWLCESGTSGTPESLLIVIRAVTSPLGENWSANPLKSRGWVIWASPHPSLIEEIRKIPGAAQGIGIHEDFPSRRGAGQRLHPFLD